MFTGQKRRFTGRIGRFQKKSLGDLKSPKPYPERLQVGFLSRENEQKEVIYYYVSHF